MRIATAVFAALVAFAALAYMLLPQSKPVAAGIQAAGGVDPRAFALLDGRGRTVELESFRGKPVLLNFWATWCPPCLDELPSLLKFADSARRKVGVETIAVSVDESWGPINELFNRNKLWLGTPVPLTILLDSGGSVAVSFGTLKYPESYFIDRSFKVIRKFIGVQDWESQEIMRWVTEHSK